MSEPKPITAAQVNAVLKLVVKLTDDGDEQLWILTYALAVALKVACADPDQAIRMIRDILGTELDLTPLDLCVAAGETVN